MTPTPDPAPSTSGLAALRSRIDQLDAALIAIVAERLAVCREVAAVKQHSDTPVIQPQRVRDVVTSRRQQAIEAGVDADFAEQLFRVLLTETHRIEVAGHRPDPAPEKAMESALAVMCEPSRAITTRPHATSAARASSACALAVTARASTRAASLLALSVAAFSAP